MPSTDRELYIGLMSGTSLDGIDCVLAEFKNHTCSILHATSSKFPPDVRNELGTIIQNSGSIDLDRLGIMNVRLAGLYAIAVLDLLDTAEFVPANIIAVGCHGQTVRHQTVGPDPFTTQLGSGAALAVATGIAVVNDFRSADIALGGEGAPLASGFHRWLFSQTDEVRGVINIGGIANLTLLDPEQPVTGFDTGPGNTLLDGWIQRHQNQAFDANGQWAASAEPHDVLLQHLLKESYFSQPAPKSTGRELFNLDWLDVQLETFGETLAPAVVQATLAELSATTIARSLNKTMTKTAAVCGGGAHNDYLMQRLKILLPNVQITTTQQWGISPDIVEAAAFAWLARARLNKQVGNIPSVTGAKGPAILGALHLPPS